MIKRIIIFLWVIVFFITASIRIDQSKVVFASIDSIWNKSMVYQNFLKERESFIRYSEKNILTETPQQTFRICSPLEQVEMDDLEWIISSPYDPPPMGKDERHQGVDFSYHRWKKTGPIHGVIVQSVFSGVVIASLKNTFPYGNLIIVETTFASLPKEISESLKLSSDDSLYLLYAHLDGAPWRGVGQRVVPCQSLGLVGKSGNAIVPHLHFEARVGLSGAVFTGLSRFVDEANDFDKENYLLWRISGKFVHFNPMEVFSFKQIEKAHFNSVY